MLGAIAGDIIGSIHEFGLPPGPDTPLFAAESHYTDDTLLTLATAHCLLDGLDYAESYRQACLDNPRQAWGTRFRAWAEQPPPAPAYDSLGNGSAMRVSPIGWWAEDADMAIAEATRSAEVTHNHPEGIRGAVATALAVFMARHGAAAGDIAAAVYSECGYVVAQPFDYWLEHSHYNETCAGTVPPALGIALLGQNFESVMKMALALDADSDTLACIAGGVAEARFGVPEWIRREVEQRLAPEQLALLARFYRSVNLHGVVFDGV